MANTLIIYDNDGYVIQQITGSYRIPVGVPYLEIEIPNEKQVDSVDVSVIPHRVNLEDIPKSDVQLLQEQVDALNIGLAEMMGV